MRPTTSARTPRAASSIARAIPARAERAVRHDAEPAQAEQERAALRLGVDRVAQPAQRRPQQQPAGLRARARRRRLAHRAEQRVRGPLHHLEEDVAGEAVGDDHVGLARADGEALDVAGELEPVGAPASAACAACTSSVPFVGSVPLDEQRDARALEPDHRLHERRAHVRELDEVLGPHLDVGAAVEQQERPPGDRHEHRQRRAVHAAGALDVEQPRGERGAGRAARHERVGAAVGDRADRLHDRGRPASRAPRARGRRALAIETGASTISTPGAGSICAGRPEHEHAHLAARGGERGAARDLGGAGVGAVRVEGDRQLLSGHGRWA